MHGYKYFFVIFTQSSLDYRGIAPRIMHIHAMKIAFPFARQQSKLAR